MFDERPRRRIWSKLDAPQNLSEWNAVSPPRPGGYDHKAIGG